MRTGKKTRDVIRTILEVRPSPNQITNKGANAIFGAVLSEKQERAAEPALEPPALGEC